MAQGTPDRSCGGPGRPGSSIDITFDLQQQLLQPLVRNRRRAASELEEARCGKTERIRNCGVGKTGPIASVANGPHKGRTDESRKRGRRLFRSGWIPIVFQPYRGRNPRRADCCYRDRSRHLPELCWRLNLPRGGSGDSWNGLHAPHHSGRSPGTSPFWIVHSSAWSVDCPARARY